MSFAPRLQGVIAQTTKERYKILILSHRFSFIDVAPTKEEPWYVMGSWDNWKKCVPVYDFVNHCLDERTAHLHYIELLETPGTLIPGETYEFKYLNGDREFIEIENGTNETVRNEMGTFNYTIKVTQLADVLKPLTDSAKWLCEKWLDGIGDVRFRLADEDVEEIVAPSLLCDPDFKYRDAKEHCYCHIWIYSPAHAHDLYCKNCGRVNKCVRCYANAGEDCKYEQRSRDDEAGFFLGKKACISCGEKGVWNFCREHYRIGCERCWT